MVGFLFQHCGGNKRVSRSSINESLVECLFYAVGLAGSLSFSKIGSVLFLLSRNGVFGRVMTFKTLVYISFAPAFLVD